MASWTSEQKEAINARNCNLLVAAAAGSGKTTVLVERIIKLVLEGQTDINRLLIVTFTQAAAGEMRERINAAFLKELESKKADGHLGKQLYLINRSSISTIHAFCSDVVRRHFHLVNIDPHFRIADSTESELIKMEALEELLDKEYLKGDEGFISLLEAFSGNKDDKSLEALILRVHGFIQSHPQPLNWLRENIEQFSLIANTWADNRWAKELSQQIAIELSAAHDILCQALKLSNKTGGPQGYLKAICSDLEWVKLLLEAADKGLPDLHSSLQERSFTRLGRLSRDVDENLKNQVKALRDESKKIISTIHKMLGRDPLEYLQDLNEIYPLMHCLGEMVESFTETYQEKKRGKGLVDFNDLEHLALQILDNDAVAEEYRSFYDYIFIDEYQDSNLVQETILNYIKREDNLFMVGDVKQSIYRFRLADPTLFLEKQDIYPLEEGSINRRIDLNKNFRSHPEILDSVNYIFRHLMSKEIGEIDYDERSYLYPGLSTNQELESRKRNGESGQEEAEDIGNTTKRVEIYILENNPDTVSRSSISENEEQDITNGIEDDLIERIIEMDNSELEAVLVAQKIRQLLEEEIYDSKLQYRRKLEYRDIVVLLRATRNSVGVFLEQLSAEGIPVYTDASSGFFDTLELNLFINLLRLIDNKRQDIALLSVLRSPIGGFSIDDFIQIRTKLKPQSEKPAPSFYEALEIYIEENNDDLKDRLVAFIKRLRRWGLESRIMPLDEFIGKLFTDTGFYYYTGAMPGGIQRQANLRILLHRAKEFQKSSFKGLFSFIKYIERIKSSGNDMGNACIIGENDNVVRIMSIHKSKGLEFPVVILSGLGKYFNIRDSNEDILLHQKLGIGPRYINSQLRTYHDTLARLAIRNRIKLENLAEEMRILYVACTRPQERLIMMGTTRKLERAWPGWCKAVNSYNQSRARNYLDWLIPIIIRHKEGGESLREISGAEWREEELWEDESRWKVELINPGQLALGEIRRKKKKHEWLKILEQGGYPNFSPENEEIKQRLNWEYPYLAAEKTPAKLSVTQVSRIGSAYWEDVVSDTALTRVPAFLSDKEDRKTEFAPLERGLFFHLVMQNLDYNRVDQKNSIKQQLDEMADKDILTTEQLAIIEVNKIWRFFQSSLGERVLQAGRLFREAPFNLLLPANEVFPDRENQEELLIQGVIDLYFYEGGEIVLLDFKSDSVRHKNEEEILSPYRTQIKLYQKALESITGKRVKESYLYFFDLDRAIKV